MNESVKMFLVLVGVTATCGVLLSAVHEVAGERIELQHIRYVKGPAIRSVLSDVDNDPLVDRKVVTVTGKPVTLFIGKKEETVTGIALETGAQGYGGLVQVITGFAPATGKCTAVAIAGASETPGIGTKVMDTKFTGQFIGLSLEKCAALTAAGGSIDGISGATISSKAVCNAVAEAQELFASVRPLLGENAE